MSIFEMFYNSDPQIVEVVNGGGYSDVGTQKAISTMRADVQPYNGGLARKEYGVTEECQKRMYYDVNDDVTVGRYALIGGIRYRIVYTEEWNLGSVALLQREEGDSE